MVDTPIDGGCRFLPRRQRKIEKIGSESRQMLALFFRFVMFVPWPSASTCNSSLLDEKVELYFGELKLWVFSGWPREISCEIVVSPRLVIVVEYPVTVAK